MYLPEAGYNIFHDKLPRFIVQNIFVWGIIYVFTFYLLEAKRKQEEKEKEEEPWNELDVSTPELVITTDNIQDSKKVCTEEYFSDVHCFLLWSK